MWIWDAARWLCVLGWSLAVRYWWAGLALAVAFALAGAWQARRRRDAP